MNTVQKGDISEAKVLARFIELGYTVLLPWSNGLRYDMVIDRGDGIFRRIQVKTAKMYDDNAYLRFNVSATNGSSHIRTRYTSSQIDYFAVYCPENDKCYLVDVNIVGINVMLLRLKLPKNNQYTNVRWARDYEL
jgi:hypothetical protein